MDGFRFKCPHCYSFSVHREVDHRLSSELIVGCSTCGWHLYGEAKVSEEVEKQQATWLLDKRRRDKEDKKRREEERRRQAELLARNCAWRHCSKGPDGSTAERRKTSKYCSRDCSNRNARWRHDQRASELPRQVA